MRHDRLEFNPFMSYGDRFWRVIFLLIVMVLALAVLTACNDRPPRPVDDVARTAVVGQYEDCTLYRTNTTGGPDITWVRCGARPKVVEANHTESCGKGCTRHVKTVTVEEPK